MKFLIGNPVVASLSVRGLAIAIKSVQLIVLVRFYGSELFGVYSVALGVFGLTMVIAQLGLDHYVQREAASRNSKNYAHILRIGRFLVLPALAAALIAQVMVWNFYARDVALVFTVLVVAAPVYAISWNQIFFLRGSGRINLSLVLFEIVNPIILILAAIVFRGSDLGLAIAFLFASVATLVLTFIYTNMALTGETEDVGSHPSISGSVIEARSFYGTSILQAIQSLADGLVVGFFLRPVDAALYAIVTRMAGLVLMPITILSIYMKNFVAKLREQPLSVIWGQMRTFTFASVFLSAAVWAALLTLLPFVGALFGISFPLEAQWTYFLVVTTRALQGAAAPVDSALFMSGRENYITRIHTVLLPPYLCILLLFVPTHGLLGVGLSLLGYAMVSISATIYILTAKLQS
jgi:O-antigen/teichoic acid export membrane protein